MNKQSIIYSIVLILVVVALVWWSKAASKSDFSPADKTANSQAENTALVVDQVLHDFGTISMKNGKVSKEFKITNNSDTGIKLTNVTTSCMCTNAFIVQKDGTKKGPYGMPGHGGFVPKANEVISAGETRAIEVVYDPNAHGPAGIGRIDRFVYLEDESGNKLELEIKANVTP